MISKVSKEILSAMHTPVKLTRSAHRTKVTELPGKILHSQTSLDTSTVSVALIFMFRKKA